MEGHGAVRRAQQIACRISIRELGQAGCQKASLKHSAEQFSQLSLFSLLQRVCLSNAGTVEEEHGRHLLLTDMPHA